MGDVGKMITVGLVWGATNALMRKGALIWDNKIKSNPQTNTSHNPVLNNLKNWLQLVLTWQYSLPFALNLSASATFFAILSDTPISFVVPVTNATTFAATAVFGMLLGEETHVGLALFGTFLIVLGVYVCVRWRDSIESLGMFAVVIDHVVILTQLVHPGVPPSLS